MRLQRLDLTHRRLMLLWTVSLVGLALPWLIADIEWRPSFMGGGAERACRVASIYDGDTLRAICDGERIKVRFYCIDAPEMAQQSWGRASRDHLRRITPETVTLRVRDTDDYGRKVGEILTVDGVNLNQRMVADGQAAVYPRYCHDQRYYRLQREAKQQGVGIWARPGLHQAPWKYRQQQR